MSTRQQKKYYAKKYTPEQKLEYFKSKLDTTERKYIQEGYKEGKYPPEQEKLLMNNAKVFLFNNCLIGVCFLNDLYIGKESIQYLERQTYYQGKVITNTAELRDIVGMVQRKIPSVSTGCMPAAPGDNIIVCNIFSEAYKYTIMSFFNKNLFCLSKPELEAFIAQSNIRIDKAAMIEQILTYQGNPTNGDVFNQMFQQVNTNYMTINDWTADYKNNLGSWNLHISNFNLLPPPPNQNNNNNNNQ